MPFKHIHVIRTLNGLQNVDGKLTTIRCKTKVMKEHVPVPYEDTHSRIIYKIERGILYKPINIESPPFFNRVPADPPPQFGAVVSLARYVQVPVGGVRFRADSFERPETRLCCKRPVEHPLDIWPRLRFWVWFYAARDLVRSASQLAGVSEPVC